MGHEALPPGVPLGLLELDSDGTVLYYKPDGGAAGRAGSGEGIVGRNFFADVMRAADCGELRDRLGEFWRGHDPTRKFDFTFNTEHAPLPAKVLLARTREHTAGVERESVFVYIRRA